MAPFPIQNPIFVSRVPLYQYIGILISADIIGKAIGNAFCVVLFKNEQVKRTSSLLRITWRIFSKFTREKIRRQLTCHVTKRKITILSDKTMQHNRKDVLNQFSFNLLTPDNRVIIIMSIEHCKILAIEFDILKSLYIHVINCF